MSFKCRYKNQDGHHHCTLCFIYIFYRVITAGKDSTAPYFPVETLKTFVMQALKTAVVKGADHIRDPIGGSNANLFV